MFKTFKNIVVFNLVNPLAVETLTEALEKNHFAGHGSFHYRRSGFTAPTKFNESLIHKQGDQVLIALKTEEKILPSSVIKHEFDKQVKAEEKQLGKLDAKYKRNLKDDITLDLLSKAFSRFTTTHAIIDLELKRIIINTSSQSKAEDFMSILRKSIGELAAHSFWFNRHPKAQMTDWVRSNMELEHFTIDDEFEFRSIKIEGEQDQIVKSKHIEISSAELDDLKATKNVHKLAMTWDDRISFVLDDALAIKRLRYLDSLMDEVEETEGEDSRFFADFILISNSLRELVTNIAEIVIDDAQ